MPQVATKEAVAERRATGAPVDEVEVGLSSEVALRNQTARPQRPVVRVKVAYLGSNPYRSMALPGRIMTEVASWKEVDGERVPEKVLKSIADSGNTSYEFRLRDNTGELIKKQILSDQHPVHEVRGRVWAWVEHPDHAYAFASYRNKETKQPEFQLLGDASAMQLLEEYFLRVNRTKRDKQREIVEVTG
jgi:hypothetical protein